MHDDITKLVENAPAMVCGYCMAELGLTEGCPSCEPIVKLRVEFNGECYAYMLFGGYVKPDGYDRWLERRKRR